MCPSTRMTGMPFLTSRIMVIITRYSRRNKDGKIKILGSEDSICPICGGRLVFCGTCHRKAVIPTDTVCKNVRDVQTVEYILRVLVCRRCGKTHRELPSELALYKRHSLSLICQEIESPYSLCDTSTALCLKLWVDWFTCYALTVAAGLALTGVCLRTMFSRRRRRYDDSGTARPAPVRAASFPAWSIVRIAAPKCGIVPLLCLLVVFLHPVLRV